jgi:hypothetical protein
MSRRDSATGLCEAMMSGSVYFILNPATGALKVGWSESPEDRLRTLQTASPDRLTLLGSVEGDLADEATMHEALAEYRLEGEWFRATQDVLRRITDFLAGGVLPTEPAEWLAYSTLVDMLRRIGYWAFSLSEQDGTRTEASRARAESIKDLARTVGAVSGLDGLQRVSDAVEAYVERHDPERLTWIMYCLDHRFDGVAGWWA